MWYRCCEDVGISTNQNELSPENTISYAETQPAGNVTSLHQVARIEYMFSILLANEQPSEKQYSAIITLACPKYDRSEPESLR